LETILVIAALSIPLALNLWATRLVVADDLSSGSQKYSQLALVWLLPLLGAVVVLAVHRKAEPPSRKHRTQPDLGDDFTMSGKSVNATKEALDGD
jgi:hypothetical protein